jgi:hypothetical protein
VLQPSEVWRETGAPGDTGLRGTLAEPIRDVRDIEIHTYPKDRVEPGTARPASVGSIIRTRPSLDVVVSFPHAEPQHLKDTARDLHREMWDRLHAQDHTMGGVS